MGVDKTVVNGRLDLKFMVRLASEVLVIERISDPTKASGRSNTQSSMDKEFNFLQLEKGSAWPFSSAEIGTLFRCKLNNAGSCRDLGILVLFKTLCETDMLRDVKDGQEKTQAGKEKLLGTLSFNCWIL